MFTSVDKALVALVMAVLFILNTWTGWFEGVTEEWVATIIAIITPLIVYFIPNRQT